MAERDILTSEEGQGFKTQEAQFRHKVAKHHTSCENHTSGIIRLIHPRSINPAAYCIQIVWNGIFLLL